MEETTAAWLAALIDGEGSVMLNKRTYSRNTKATTPRGRGIQYRPVVIVLSNTAWALHEAVQNRVDCQTYNHRRPDTERYARSKPDCWTSRWNVGQIAEYLPQVRPWLVIKAEQADLLLEAMEIKKLMSPRKGVDPKVIASACTPRLDEIYNAIRELNTRGRRGGDA